MKKKFDITVIGSERVGKTSLLSSINSQFSKTLEDNFLEVTPLSDKDLSLENNIKDLKKAFNTNTQIPLNNADVVLGTEIDINSTMYDYQYNFLVGLKDKKPKIELSFIDYPGEQLLNNRNKVIERIKKCSVTIIAIDTPALMFKSAKENQIDFHKKKNLLADDSGENSIIEAIFRESYKDLEENKLVILSPVKCEKWMGDSSKIMHENIKSGYKNLLDFFSNALVKDKVAVIIAPIETLGNIFYVYMENQDTYSPKFIKESIWSKYNPRNSDTILNYIMCFILKRYIDKPGIWYEWFGVPKPFIKAFHSFRKKLEPDALSVNAKSGFCILQGEELFI
ncbi:MAG: hypothetical protein QM669_01420 [Siphonobacter sp.]